MDRVGAEVGCDAVTQHIQFHRALEKNTAEPIVVVVQRTLNGGEDGLGEVGGVVLRAEIAHIKAQSLFQTIGAVGSVLGLAVIPILSKWMNKKKIYQKIYLR